MFNKIIAALVLSLAPVIYAQQPQTDDIPPTQPIFATNAKYVNGVAPGYWPTANASGLTLHISAGTSNFSDTIRTYAGSDLTMVNGTNYVYLDESTGIPNVSSSAFISGQFPIAIVVANGGNITSVQDVRTMFFTNGGGSPVVVEVNGTPISPSSPADFVDSDSVTFDFTSGQIKAHTVGAGCEGTVPGDNSSTNCGFQNRLGDTDTPPASVSTFGSQNLADNSGDNVVAVGNSNGGENSANEVVLLGDTNGTSLTGNDATIIGDSNAQYTNVTTSEGHQSLVAIGKTNMNGITSSNCHVIEGAIVIGESNRNPCQGATLGNAFLIGIDNLSESDHTTTNSASVTDTVAIGWENGWQGSYSGGQRVLGTYAEAVLIGSKAAAEISSAIDVVAIGDFPLCCSGSSFPNVSVSDIVAIGDLPGSGIVDGESVDVLIGLVPGGAAVSLQGLPPGTEQIGIGDAVLNNSLGTDTIAIGDDSLSSILDITLRYNTGHDVIAIGNHTLQANTTGSDNVAIGDYAGCVLCGPNHIGNANLTGSHNVWIGDTAGPNTTSQLDNTVAIGYQAYNTVSNQVVIGNPSITSLILFGSGDGCLESSSGIVTGSGSPCGSGGSGSAFSALTGGTNNSATMVVDTGASLSYANTGVVNANQITGISISGTPLAGYALIATSPSAASWSPAGTGTVTVSGSPIAGNLAAFTSGTNITVATVTQVNNLIKTLSGCGTSGNVYTPQGADCVPQSGGSPAFSVITSGTNSTATMHVAAGAVLDSTGGSIVATAVPASGITGTTLPVAITTASGLTTVAVGTLGTAATHATAFFQAALGYTPAHAGANSDITSLSSLSTALSPSQGGTGGSGTGYAKGNGASNFTYVTTIPGADVSGNIPGNAGNLFGTPTLPNGTKCITQTANDNSLNCASTAYVNNPGNISPTGITMSGTGPSTILFGAVTLATLNAAFPCNSGNTGRHATVSDSTTNVWGAVITGGSSNVVGSFCNGSSWTVESK